MVLDKIAEFLGHLLKGHVAMSASLDTVLTKLGEQATAIAAQGAQIDKLIADRDAKEQADLQKISDLLDANAAASKANADKVAGALAPDASVDQAADLQSEAATRAAADSAVAAKVDLDPATGLPRT